MPQAIAWVIEEVAVYVYDAYMIEGLAVAAGYAAGALAVFALYKAAQFLGPKPPGGTAQDLAVSITDPMAGARIVLGTVRSGGVYTIPPFNEGSHGENLHIIISLAGHEIDSFGDVYIGQDQIPHSAIGGIAGTSFDGLFGAGAGKWTGFHWARLYTGTSTQTADYILTQAFPSAFTADFRGRGIAYAALKLVLDQGSNQGQLGQWSFVMNGAKVYDPRLDSTQAGGSGTQRYATPSTWTFSRNPALQFAWLLMNSDLGGGFDPATEIDWATVAAAANVCDTSMTGATASPTGTRVRYTCDCVLDATNDLIANLRVILDTMAGHMVCLDGVWRVYAGAWTSPTNNISYTDFIGAVSIQCVTPRTTTGQVSTERFNGVRGYFIDSSSTGNWQRKECYPRVNDTYKTNDNGERIWKELELTGITDEYQCQRVCEFALRQSRNQIVLSGPLGPKWGTLATFDVIQLSWADMSWVNKPFRVISMTDTLNGGVNVVLREEQSGDWTDLATAEYNTQSTATLPAINPTIAAAPASLTGDTTNPLTIDFTWPAAAVEPSGTIYALRKASVSSYGVSSEFWRGKALRYTYPIFDVTTHYYWVESWLNNTVCGTYPTSVSGNGVGIAASLIDLMAVTSGTFTEVWTDTSVTSYSIGDTFISGAVAFKVHTIGPYPTAVQLVANISGFAITGSGNPSIGLAGTALLGVRANTPATISGNVQWDYQLPSSGAACGGAVNIEVPLTLPLSTTYPVTFYGIVSNPNHVSNITLQNMTLKLEVIKR